MCKWHHVFTGSPEEKMKQWGVSGEGDQQTFFNGYFSSVASVANLSSFKYGWLWISWCVCFVYRLLSSHLLWSCRHSSWHPAFVGKAAVAQVRSHRLITGKGRILKVSVIFTGPCTYVLFSFKSLSWESQLSIHLFGSAMLLSHTTETHTFCSLPPMISFGGSVHDPGVHQL